MAIFHIMEPFFILSVSSSFVSYNFFAVTELQPFLINNAKMHSDQNYRADWLIQ